MPAELYLFDVEILTGRGFELQYSGPIRAELGSGSKFRILRRTLLGERDLLVIAAADIRLEVSSRPATGIGARLRRGRSETTVLEVTEETKQGTSRQLALAVSHIGLDDLRAALAEAIPRWTAPFVEERLRSYQLRRPLDAPAVEEENAELEAIARRGIVPAEQIELLRAELLHLAAPTPAPRVAASPTPPGEAPTQPDRIERLKTLADLLASGALTREEFEAEKARLLRGP